MFIILFLLSLPSLISYKIIRRNVQPGLAPGYALRRLFSLVRGQSLLTTGGFFNPQYNQNLTAQNVVNGILCPSAVPLALFQLGCVFGCIVPVQQDGLHVVS